MVRKCSSARSRVAIFHAASCRQGRFGRAGWLDESVDCPSLQPPCASANPVSLQARETGEVAVRTPEFLNTMMLAQCGNASIMDHCAFDSTGNGTGPVSGLLSSRLCMVSISFCLSSQAVL